MSRHDFDLDRAIDHVAARLTHVEDDAQFASRIVAALPERLTWFGWLMQSWAPRLAMTAIIAGSLVLWASRRTTDITPTAQPLASVSDTSWPQLVAAISPEPRIRGAIGAAGPVRTQPLERLERTEPLEAFDGLPPVAAPKALAVVDIAPEAIGVEAALRVPSLSVADLPLTAESFPERD